MKIEKLFSVYSIEEYKDKVCAFIVLLSSLIYLFLMAFKQIFNLIQAVIMEVELFLIAMFVLLYLFLPHGQIVNRID